MTNLEKNAAWLKDRISYYRAEHSLPYSLKLAIGELYQMVREKKGSDFEPENLVDWLSEEYKKPIKLKQWEKDLIEAYQERLGVDHAFYSNYILEELKERGHFKGVMDTSMNTRIILENCEVIE